MRSPWSHDSSGHWHVTYQLMKIISMPQKAALHWFNIFVLQSLWSASILWLKALHRFGLVPQTEIACLWLRKEHVRAFGGTL